MDQPQQRIGKYEVLARVGKGAMGEVFKAKDPILNRFVAIKIISANLVSDEQFRRRFLQEARSAAQLNHRHIVTVYEFNEEPQVFMVMEFLDGSDLRDAIQRKTSLRVEEKLGILEQVCEGLSYAHSKGIIHRDLKPANIRLLPNLTPKIMDFGLARLGTSEITRAGTVMGTPDYMSPEQVRAEKVDDRSDVFSAGAVLYHLLSGRKPFESESVHSILFEVLERDPPPIAHLVPDLPPLVSPIVERALRKDPAQRFQTALAFREALRDARRAIAAGRAAAAALGPVELDATITRIEAPPASFPSMTPTVPSMTGRSGPSGAAARGGPTLGSVARSTTGSSSVSPPTIASLPGTIVDGATALDIPHPESEPTTARPEATFVGTIHEPPRLGRLILVSALALALVSVAGVFTWRAIHSRLSPVNEQKRADQLQKLLQDQSVELARMELANKDYEKAEQEAQAVVSQDPAHVEALDVLTKAREAKLAVETAAKEARGAVERDDLDAAQNALSRVLSLAPRHPVVAELSQALNERFRKQAEEARSRAAESRRAASSGRATAQAPFLSAERLVGEATARLTEGEYVEATRKFLEARDGFDRARREGEAEAARVAAVAAAAAAATRPAAPPPTSLAAVERTPPTTVAPAVPSGSLLSPPAPPPPVVSPGSPAVPSLPAAPSTAPVVNQEVAVRRVIADYARAIESRDLTLYKSLMPGLTADQEKSLRDAFKAVKSQQVSLAVEGVQMDGAKATVRLSRQDTVNGQQQKPRQQTFRLVQRGGAWTIESIGQ